MRLLLDEQLSLELARPLQRLGHDVLSVARAGPRGQDAAVLAWAVMQRRAVATNNIRDFRPLHAEALSSAQTHYGIVLIASTKFSWRMSALGKMVTALDQLLRSHGGVDDLGGREIFL